MSVEGSKQGDSRARAGSRALVAGYLGRASSIFRVGAVRDYLRRERDVELPDIAPRRSWLAFLAVSVLVGSALWLMHSTSVPVGRGSGDDVEVRSFLQLLVGNDPPGGEPR